MSHSQLFEHDQQFMRLVRRETDVDLVTAALEIAGEVVEVLSSGGHTYLLLGREPRLPPILNH